LNGPAVIEQEAGIDEFDAGDRALIWSVDGGEQRTAIGLADKLIGDDRDLIRAAVLEAVSAGVPPAGSHRSERIDVLGSRLASLDLKNAPAPQDLRRLWGPTFAPIDGASPAKTATSSATMSRGRRWLSALAATEPVAVIPSVIRADTDDASYIAVVPDPQNPFHRARNGEVGLTESWALAETIEEVVSADAAVDVKRAVVAVVDLPSQAYGRIEEMAGLHHAIAAAVDAYHRARDAGHPTVAIVVGQALSGGFLAHGLQAQQILALDDPGVQIHAMHKSAAARITLRTVDELEKLAETVLPLSYNVRDWAQLGFCDGLLRVSDADAPTADDISAVRRAVDAAIAAARSGPRDLSNRLDSPGAWANRRASRAIRDVMSAQWQGAQRR
jgi:malonate decarboxylase beta subunit